MADYTLSVTSATYTLSFTDVNLVDTKYSFNDPLVSMVNKIKEDTNVQTLLPSFNNVFGTFIADDPTIPGIYVSEILEEFEPIMGFQQSKNNILLSDNSKWQLDCLHNLSIEHAYELGVVACRSLLPSIVDAGLFNLKYSLGATFKDENYGENVYRAVFIITCKSRHKII